MIENQPLSDGSNERKIKTLSCEGTVSFISICVFILGPGGKTIISNEISQWLRSESQNQRAYLLFKYQHKTNVR